MIRVVSHQPADLFFAGPDRRRPEKGGILLKMGTNTFDHLSPAHLARFERDQEDGLCSVEHIIDQVVA